MQPVDFNKAVAGMDISHYQGPIDWQTVKASQQIGAVSIKATEGASYIDPALAANAAGAKAVGIPIQLYHFARPNQTPAVAEAANFIAQLKTFPFDLLPALDLEQPTDVTMDKTALIQWVHDFVNAVKQQIGQDVIVYTGKWFADRYNDFDEQLAAYPLWLSQYVDSYDPPPVDFGGWTQWVGWQHTDKGTVSGVQGPVDLDIIYDLDAIRLKVPAVEPPAPQFLLSKEDQEYIVNRWINHEFDLASDTDKVERHRLANQLRIASGQVPVEM